jgi:large subunit ribosomal protein L22
MLSKAVEKYIRLSPRKARYVMGALRNRTVAQALNILQTTPLKACRPISKAIISAFSNAKQHDPSLIEENVVISKIAADGGPVWKRFRSAAFGRAVGIRKPTSHIIVELDRLSQGKRPTREQEIAAKKMPKASKPQASDARKAGKEQKQISAKKGKN